MTTLFELPISVAREATRKPWSEELAQQIAMRDGLGRLSETHWRLIHTLRSHFIQYGGLPPMRLACAANLLEPGCVEQLFHNAREAWRVAGLPDPSDEGRGSF